MEKLNINNSEALKNKKDLEIMNKLWDVNESGILNGIAIYDLHIDMKNKLTQFSKNGLLRGNFISNLQSLINDFKAYLNKTSDITNKMSSQIELLKQAFKSWDKLHNDDVNHEHYNIAKSHMLKTTLNPLCELHLSSSNDINNMKKTLYDTIHQLITNVLIVNADKQEVISLLNLIKLDLEGIMDRNHIL